MSTSGGFVSNNIIIQINLAFAFFQLKFQAICKCHLFMFVVFIGVPLIVPFRINATPMFLRISNEDQRLGECVMYFKR